MGTCCRTHLAARIRNGASNARNGAVTIKVIEDPHCGICSYIVGHTSENTPIYCATTAEFMVSYYSK